MKPLRENPKDPIALMRLNPIVDDDAPYLVESHFEFNEIGIRQPSPPVQRTYFYRGMLSVALVIGVVVTLAIVATFMSGNLTDDSNRYNSSFLQIPRSHRRRSLSDTELVNLKSIKDIIIQGEYNKTVTGEPLIHFDSRIRNPNDSAIIIFSSPQGITMMKGWTRKIDSFDGSFQLKPSPFAQIYTISKLIENRVFAVAYPIAFAMLEDTTPATYTRLFDILKNDLSYNMHNSITTDVNLHVVDAIKSNWPTIYRRVSLFHIAFDLMKHIEIMNLTEFYNNNEAAQTSVRRLLSLSFLYVNTVPSSFKMLTKTFPTELSSILRYFNQTFINGPDGHCKFPPLTWHYRGAYGDEIRRLPNAVATFNSKFRQHFNETEVALSEIIKAIKVELESTRVAYTEHFASIQRKSMLDVDMELKRVITQNDYSIGINESNLDTFADKIQKILLKKRLGDAYRFTLAAEKKDIEMPKPDEICLDKCYEAVNDTASFHNVTSVVPICCLYECCDDGDSTDSSLNETFIESVCCISNGCKSENSTDASHNEIFIGAACCMYEDCADGDVTDIPHNETYVEYVYCLKEWCDDENSTYLAHNETCPDSECCLYDRLENDNATDLLLNDTSSIFECCLCDWCNEYNATDLSNIPTIRSRRHNHESWGNFFEQLLESFMHFIKYWISSSIDETVVPIRGKRSSQDIIMLDSEDDKDEADMILTEKQYDVCYINDDNNLWILKATIKQCTELYMIIDTEMIIGRVAKIENTMVTLSTRKGPKKYTLEELSRWNAGHFRLKKENNKKNLALCSNDISVFPTLAKLNFAFPTHTYGTNLEFPTKPFDDDSSFASEYQENEIEENNSILNSQIVFGIKRAINNYGGESLKKFAVMEPSFVQYLAGDWFKLQHFNFNRDRKHLFFIDGGSYHFTLLDYSVEAKTLTYYDSILEKNHGKMKIAIESAAKYIYYFYGHEMKIEDIIFARIPPKYVQPPISNDCGLFVLQFATDLIRYNHLNSPKNFNIKALRLTLKHQLESITKDQNAAWTPKSLDFKVDGTRALKRPLAEANDCRKPKIAKFEDETEAFFLINIWSKLIKSDQELLEKEFQSRPLNTRLKDPERNTIAELLTYGNSDSAKRTLVTKFFNARNAFHKDYVSQYSTSTTPPSIAAQSSTPTPEPSDVSSQNSDDDDDEMGDDDDEMWCDDDEMWCEDDEMWDEDDEMGDEDVNADENEESPHDPDLSDGYTAPLVSNLLNELPDGAESADWVKSELARVYPGRPAPDYRTYVVYGLVDSLGRLFYIGQSMNPLTRLNNHKSSYGNEIQMVILIDNLSASMSYDIEAMLIFICHFTLKTPTPEQFPGTFMSKPHVFRNALYARNHAESAKLEKGIQQLLRIGLDRNVAPTTALKVDASDDTVSPGPSESINALDSASTDGPELISLIDNLKEYADKSPNLLIDPIKTDAPFMNDQFENFIYALIKNGKIFYIGRTKDLHKRLGSHKSVLKDNSITMQVLIRGLSHDASKDIEAAFIEITQNHIIPKLPTQFRGQFLNNTLRTIITDPHNGNHDTIINSTKSALYTALLTPIYVAPFVGKDKGLSFWDSLKCCCDNSHPLKFNPRKCKTHPGQRKCLSCYDKEKADTYKNDPCCCCSKPLDYYRYSCTSHESWKCLTCYMKAHADTFKNDPCCCDNSHPLGNRRAMCGIHQSWKCLPCYKKEKADTFKNDPCCCDNSHPLGNRRYKCDTHNTWRCPPCYKKEKADTFKEDICCCCFKKVGNTQFKCTNHDSKRCQACQNDANAQKFKDSKCCCCHEKVGNQRLNCDTHQSWRCLPCYKKAHAEGFKNEPCCCDNSHPLGNRRYNCDTHNAWKCFSCYRKAHADTFKKEPCCCDNSHPLGNRRYKCDTHQSWRCRPCDRKEKADTFKKEHCCCCFKKVETERFICTTHDSKRCQACQNDANAQKFKDSKCCCCHEKIGKQRYKCDTHNARRCRPCYRKAHADTFKKEHCCCCFKKVETERFICTTHDSKRCQACQNDANAQKFKDSKCCCCHEKIGKQRLNCDTHNAWRCLPCYSKAHAEGFKNEPCCCDNSHSLGNRRLKCDTHQSWRCRNCHSAKTKTKH